VAGRRRRGSDAAPPGVCRRASGTACDHALIERFIITIEGPGWTDVEDIELPRLPDEGESVETKFGTMLVAHSEETPDMAAYAGRIVCRLS
jgi:hypothetical protein